MKRVFQTIKQNAIIYIGIGIFPLIFLFGIYVQGKDFVETLSRKRAESSHLQSHKEYMRNHSEWCELSDIEEFLEAHIESCEDDDCDHSKVLDSFYEVQRYYEEASCYIEDISE